MLLAGSAGVDAAAINFFVGMLCRKAQHRLKTELEGKLADAWQETGFQC